MKKLLSTILSILLVTVLLSSCSNLELNNSKDDKNSSTMIDIKSYYKTESENYSLEYKIVDGALYGKGYDKFYLFGDEELKYYDDWIKIVDADNIIHLDADGGVVIYLTDDGNLYGFGYLDGGVLQKQNISENDGDNFINKPVLLFENCKYASIGVRFIVAIKDDNSLWFWGESKNGQSTKVEDSIMTPTKIADDVQIAEGFGYTTAWIDSKNWLYVCGDNSYGQLGNGEKGTGFPTLFEDNYPKPFCVLKNCVEFYSFDDGKMAHAKTKDGLVYEWGNNKKVVPTIVRNQ